MQRRNSVGTGVILGNGEDPNDEEASDLDLAMVKSDAVMFPGSSMYHARLNGKHRDLSRTLIT
jgi:hypothetical protein